MVSRVNRQGGVMKPPVPASRNSQSRRVSNARKSPSDAGTSDATGLYPDLAFFSHTDVPLTAAELNTAGQNPSFATQTEAATQTDVTARINDQQRDATESAQKADPAVVKALRKSAFVHAGIAVALGLFFVAAVATAVASGGLAIPVAALSGAAFMVAVSDAGMAFYNWNSKKKGGDELPMKADSVGNLLYLVTYCIKSVTGSDREISDKAKKYIHYVSSALHLAIYLAPVVLSWVGMALIFPTLVSTGATAVITPMALNTARTFTVVADSANFVTGMPVSDTKNLAVRRENYTRPHTEPGGDVG